MAPGSSPGPMPAMPPMTPQYGPGTQYAQEPVETRRRSPDVGPFRQGKIEVNGQIGAAFGGETYFILGAGAGYYVLDGLRVGLQSALWFLSSPVIFTLTPEATYVMHFVPIVKPYAGGFFRGYIVGDNVPDTTAIGARAGVALPILMGHGYAGGGLVYEHFLSCGEFRDCDSVYPEVGMALSF